VHLNYLLDVCLREIFLSLVVFALYWSTSVVCERKGEKRLFSSIL